MVCSRSLDFAPPRKTHLTLEFLFDTVIAINKFRRSLFFSLLQNLLQDNLNPRAQQKIKVKNPIVHM